MRETQVSNGVVKSRRRFLVHVIRNLEESQKKLKELFEEGFNLIGIEIPIHVAELIPLHVNILHEDSHAACIVALGCRALLKLNCVVIFKADLDSLMAAAVLKKIAYRETFTEKDLLKIDLVARKDIGIEISEDEMDIIGRLITAVQQAPFFERYRVVYDWLIDKIHLGDFKAVPKVTRQVLVERFGKIIVLISLGAGALARRHLDSCPHVVLLNPYFPFISRNGRRYCIHSNEILDGLCDRLNLIDPVKSWGGHPQII